jgi:hypothetical protein
VVVLVLILLGTLFFVLHPMPDAGSSRERTIDLAIQDGTMTPDEVEAGEGDQVTLKVTTSDAPTEVHILGYDLEKDFAPGEPATFSLEADLTGRLEIEDHETDKVLGVLLVQPR